jgi:hypothetical protein
LRLHFLPLSMGTLTKLATMFRPFFFVVVKSSSGYPIEHDEGNRGMQIMQSSILTRRRDHDGNPIDL